MSAKLTWRTALAEHWPEYLIEGWALGMFMVSASLFTLWFEDPASSLNHAIMNGGVRRGLIGLAMGITAVLLIYSPWGKRSGAHMNPAVTVAFFSLGRIEAWNALFYVLAQFIGGFIGCAPGLGTRLAMPSQHRRWPSLPPCREAPATAPPLPRRPPCHWR